MPLMSLEEILDRVQDLKQESDEKDEVIRVQQGQINELEAKVKQLTAHSEELELKATELADVAEKAEALVERLSQMLS
jgi:methyl-accepting chemotaxis protein